MVRWWMKKNAKKHSRWTNNRNDRNANQKEMGRMKTETMLKDIDRIFDKAEGQIDKRINRLKAIISEDISRIMTTPKSQLKSWNP